MRSTDGKGTRADAISRSAVVLDLTGVQTARGLARGVTVDNCSSDVVRADAGAADGVADDETALRVAAESDLGVRAVGQGLRDEVGHDGTALAALQGVGSDGGFVVDALDRDAVGAEGGFQGTGDGGADAAAHVLLFTMLVSKGFDSGLLWAELTPGSVEPRAKMNVTGAHLPSLMSLRVLLPPPRPPPNWRFSVGRATLSVLRVRMEARVVV